MDDKEFLRIEKDMEYFVGRVVAKAADGKIPPGSKIDGQPVPNYRYFQVVGPDPDILEPMRMQKEANKFATLVQSVVLRAPDLAVSEAKGGALLLSQSNFLAVTKPPRGHDQEKKSAVYLGYINNAVGQDKRAKFSRLLLSVIFPSEVAVEFVRAVRENPDFLEDFYNKAFAGLDSDPASMGVTGVIRYKASGVYILEQKDLEEMREITNYEDVWSLREIFRNIQRYSYARSYGSLEL